MRILLLLSVLLSSFAALADNFYVSPSGSNSNPGTQAQPWQTMQYSIDQLEAGDHLFVGDGVYNEKVEFPGSGTQIAYITVSASGSAAVLDGTGLVSVTPMVAIIDQSFIRIEGLEIRNNIMNDAQGILIDGNCQGIQIVGNKIHDIHFSSNPNETADETKNAQGIIVFGSSITPITNLVIRDNELYNCRLGYSEGIAVNGNVQGFTVSGNFVHDLTNIGIVAIGHEETCSDPALDQARQGLIERNVVSGCHSPYAFCGGIYVDGAKNISIMGNKCSDNDYGIEIGCEHHGKTASEISARNNIVYGNFAAGIVVGGYDPVEAGSVINVSVLNNTLYGNNTGEVFSEISLSVAQNVQINNNIFYPKAGSVAVTENFEPVNVLYDYNLYWGELVTMTSIVFENETENYTFMQFQQAGRETNGIQADPLFAPGAFSEISNLPENMGPGSPVINAGSPDYEIFPNELDFFGNSRIQENRVDIGAAEFPANLGVSELSENLFTIFPNPAGDQLFIQTKEIISTVTITDLNGKALRKITNEFHSPIGLDGIPEGAYLIIVETGNGRSTGRFVKL